MTSPTPPVLRLGTRGSLLARTQSGIVADDLMGRHPGLRVELVTVRTTGDRITDRPLQDLGGKGLFTKELEQALLAGDIDFAVHSFKDVPVTMPLLDESGLMIAAVPPREDPRDAVVMRDPPRGPWPRGARVGTSSFRRRCQVLELLPDATVLPLRGNIDTRIRKLRDGEFDVIVLALAGLRRAGLYDPSFMQPVEPDAILPAAGQGALALQCRRDDDRTARLMSSLNDPVAARCVEAERAVVAALEGDCHSPIAALATRSPEGHEIRLRVAVGGRDGHLPVLRASAAAPWDEPAAAVEEAVGALVAAGARARLHGGT